MRPSMPVPGTRLMSMPVYRAKCLAAGLASAFWPLGLEGAPLDAAASVIGFEEAAELAAAAAAGAAALAPGSSGTSISIMVEPT